jgi:beta-glucosidase
MINPTTERLDTRAIASVVACGLAAMLCATLTAQQPPAYKDATLPVERRVADLLSRMTLEEKVAQTVALWGGKSRLTDESGNFTPEKAATVLRDGIGQITRPSDGRERKNRKRDPRETVEFVNAIQKWVIEHTRLGIPVMFHEEALHGLAALHGTNFPVPIGLASSWDEDLVERVFTVAAREARARGAQQVLAPVLDLARDPRWGRTEETYGEDPYLAARIGLAAIRGYQGRGEGPALAPERVFATAKHYAGHGHHEGGVNTAPTQIPPRLLLDEYLPPFETAVREGRVAAIMPAYNEIDGLPSHSNRWLLHHTLREQWGFNGVIVSDYNGIEQLAGRHHVAESQADAARLALESGVDLELPDGRAYLTLVDQVTTSRIEEATLDRAVGRILRLKFLAALFEQPYADPETAVRLTNTPEHRQLALDAARHSIVLLKNDRNVLPLDRSRLRTLAVIGPNAADLHLGGYSEDPGRGVSVLQGIRDKVGASLKVVYAEGSRITEEKASWTSDAVVPGDPTRNRTRIEEAVKVARTADAVLLVLGTNESTSREAFSDNHLGDMATLDLIGQQNELVEAIAATDKPVVALLLNGRPQAIERLAELVPAILEGWYLGQEGGTAVADVIFGDVNPGGKLPITVPRSVGHLPAYYSRKPTSFRSYLFSSRGPLFPFGHGLSYTTFVVNGLSITPDTIATRGSATISVTVTNTGSRAGDEVVQLYIRDRVSSVTRPVKQLRGFRRVTLAAGEKKTVTFRIGPDALAFTNEDMHRVVEPGAFDIMVGTSSETTLSGELTVVQ